MTIRRGTPDDLPALVRMGRAFLEATRYGTLFRATGQSLEALAGLLFSFADNAAIFLAVDADDQPFGMIAAFASPNPINQRLYCDEVVWWVDPSGRGPLRAGPALLRSAEDWARERKCYLIKMVAPVGSTVGMFYERHGYEAIETSYAKVL